MSPAPSPPPPLPPVTEMAVVYRVPGMDQVHVRRNVVYRTAGETRLELDVYSPSDAAAGARRGAVILIHGGPVPPGTRAKDWGGGPFLSAPLREQWPFVRAIVAYYAALDLQVPPPASASGITGETRREFSPLRFLAVAGEKTPPLFVARAGRDNPWLNATIDRFVHEATAGNASLELMTHPTGRHGFDILDDDDRSREIIGRTLDLLKHHLRPRP